MADGTTLDYEVKKEYSVEVSVSDHRNGAGETDNIVEVSLQVRINLVDAEQVGELAFPSYELRFGKEVLVEVQDPDN